MPELPPRAMYNLLKRRLQEEPVGWMMESERTFFINEMLGYDRSSCPSCGRAFTGMAALAISGGLGKGTVKCEMCKTKYEMKPTIDFTGSTSTSTGSFTGSWW